MTLYTLGADSPSIDTTAYFANEAVAIGRVSIGPQSSVWSFSVLRGDNEPIRIGARTNIQEGCVIHVDPGYPVDIGDDVTVGHQAMVHGCCIGNGSLIGMQAILLNGCKIGQNCLIGAGSLITEGKVIPDGSLVFGSPAKVIRELSAEEIDKMHRNTAGYVTRAAEFKTRLAEYKESTQ